MTSDELKHFEAGVNTIGLAGYYLTQLQMLSETQKVCPTFESESRLRMFWLGSNLWKGPESLKKLSVALARQALLEDNPAELLAEHEVANDEALPHPFSEQALRERLVQAYHDRRQAKLYGESIAAASRAERGQEMELESSAAERPRNTLVE